MAGGPASHACRRGSGSTRGFNFFVLGGSFTRSGVDGTRGLGVGGLIRCAGRPRESCGAVPPRDSGNKTDIRGTSGKHEKRKLLISLIIPDKGGFESCEGFFFSVEPPLCPEDCMGICRKCGGSGVECAGLERPITSHPRARGDPGRRRDPRVLGIVLGDFAGSVFQARQPRGKAGNDGSVFACGVAGRWEGDSFTRCRIFCSRWSWISGPAARPA